MKSTKDKFLQILLRRPSMTINELAEAVGINAISVRHHLTNLTAEGLISAEEERHGVGRPRLVYSLTEDGMEKFPTKYLRLTTRLLTQMKDSMPGPVVESRGKRVCNFVCPDNSNSIFCQIKSISIKNC